jgi:Bacterial proteasome activator
VKNLETARAGTLADRMAGGGMTDREAAEPGRVPGTGVVPPCLAVVIGRTDDASRLCRVDAPDRVLRIWALLGNAADELRQASPPPELIARLRRQLGIITAELETSLSPALASELHRLVGPEEGTELSADELRVDYAALLAWTASLLVEVLNEIDTAAARTARAGGLRAPGG